MGGYYDPPPYVPNAENLKKHSSAQSYQGIEWGQKGHFFTDACPSIFLKFDVFCD